MEDSVIMQSNIPIIAYLCLQTGSGRADISIVFICTGFALSKPTVKNVADTVPIEARFKLVKCLV